MPRAIVAVVLALFLVAADQSVEHGRDPDLTPGHLCSLRDPDFKELRYAEGIPYCRRNVSYEQKVAVGARYGLHPTEFHRYEFDHLIPLALGGSNADQNLWPLATAEARRKSRLEQQLFDRLSRGEITQRQAIDAIYAWQ